MSQCRALGIEKIMRCPAAIAQLRFDRVHARAEDELLRSRQVSQLRTRYDAQMSLLRVRTR